MRYLNRRVALAAFFGCAAAWASAAHAGDGDIYAMEDADGVIHLSNYPENASYRLLVSDGLPAGHDVPDTVKTVSQEATKGGPGARAGFARYREFIAQAARESNVDAALLHAVVAVESAYDPRAVSRKGAAGLMQLMPGTAQRYGVSDPFDPAENLRGGARYLSDLLQQYDRDLNLVLAAYNAGPTAVARYNGIPPFAETRQYVPKVLRAMRDVTAWQGPSS